MTIFDYKDDLKFWYENIAILPWTNIFGMQKIFMHECAEEKIQSIVCLN